MESVPDNVSYSRSHIAMTVLAVHPAISAFLGTMPELLPYVPRVSVRVLLHMTQLAHLDSTFIDSYVAVPRTIHLILTDSKNPLMLAYRSLRFRRVSGDLYPANQGKDKDKREGK